MVLDKIFVLFFFTKKIINIFFSFPHKSNYVMGTNQNPLSTAIQIFMIRKYLVCTEFTLAAQTQLKC